MPIHPYITTLVGCLVMRDSIYKQVGLRVCGLNKINTETPITDLSNCELESKIPDYSAFKMCPFCANSIWHSQEQVIGAVTIASTLPDVLTAFCVSTTPELFNSQWVVGYVVNHRRQDAVPAPLIETVEYWRPKVSEALIPHGLWRDVGYGFYTVVTNITTPDVS